MQPVSGAISVTPGPGTDGQALRFVNTAGVQPWARLDFEPTLDDLVMSYRVRAQQTNDTQGVLLGPAGAAINGTAISPKPRRGGARSSPRPPWQSDAMYLLASVLENRGEIAEAETWWPKAIEIGGITQNNMTIARNNLAIALYNRGEITEAETLLRSAADGKTATISNLEELLSEQAGPATIARHEPRTDEDA